jgi:hypothetical protein
MCDRKLNAVASAVLSGHVPSALRSDALGTAHTTAKRTGGFTLAELVVTVGVLVVLVLLFTQLLKSAASVTTLGHKQMDTDSQTRQLLDRMAIDFSQMVKRSDVDYYVKSSWFATNSPTPAPTGARTLLQLGNDTIAFYSTVPGYYPSSGLQSPLSLVAYRINSDPSSSAYNKMQRMGKGLVWNAVSTTDTPVVFMPIPLASALPTPELPPPLATPTPSPTPAWPEIASTGSWSDSEVIGPQVFRFEYYYLLKGQTNPAAPPPTPTPYSPIFSDTPWDTRICACPTVTPTPAVTPTPGTPTPTPTPPSVCCHVAPEGMQDVAAVVVVIAVMDPTTKVLVTDAKLARLNGADGQSQGPVLIDWGNATCAGCPTQTQWQTTPGLLGAQWRAAIDANSIGLPRPAISGIRVYERTFYLSPPTLLTP